MSVEHIGGLRTRVAVEAARLMYEEGVKQYFTAKRMAARRLLGRAEGDKTRYRPADLPSNGEIREALLRLSDLAEGSRRTRRLFAMRVIALEVMNSMLPFEPRLIGSVSTGHIRRGSDIDIQVFTDHEESLERHLRSIGRDFEREPVTIQKFGEIREYVHYHLREAFPVELTVYPVRELRFRPKSSTDGKPIVRVRPSSLQAQLEAEHAEAYRRYRETGEIEGIEEAIAEQSECPDGHARPGPFDGLLLDGPDEDALFEAFQSASLTTEETEEYDPLPGFEHWSRSS
ncbi:MAG: nucleotidyltransferase domain-containing protein [Polyangiaceae bacterium]